MLSIKRWNVWARVLQAEGHPGEFEEAEERGYGRLRHIFCSDGNLVITFHQVNFGEEAAPGEACCEVVDVGNVVGVAGGSFIEVAVVATWAGRSIFLCDHVEARAPRGIRTTTNACRAHHIEALFGDPELFGGQSPRRRLDRRSRGVDKTLDPVVGRTGG